MFFGCQVLSPMEKQGAVQPQVFAETTDLLSVVPGKRWRVNFRQQVGRATQFGDRGRIGWGRLEPLADRAMVDAELPADGSSERDVSVQRVHLGNAQRAPGQAPSIAFRLGPVDWQQAVCRADGLAEWVRSLVVASGACGGPA